ncbi:MAG TPA: hypothetical protein PLU95_03845 [Syntrophales bacterium]|nr:hypothetical protein [Smithellaceae bacterium]HPN08413.1 hypothetical protein [Syntrophales bacterium]HPX80873.1 hypothetical protein [Syntrophales bacterium]HQB13174.1 hypothetical protein [Syntrophales bacterium]
MIRILYSTIRIQCTDMDIQGNDLQMLSGSLTKDNWVFIIKGISFLSVEYSSIITIPQRHLNHEILKAFFNFIIDRCSLNMRNPCNVSLLSKTFKAPKQQPRRILDREMVDEMIYNATKQRDRLILELQARCGLRIGELLKIKVADISDRTITLWEPKSGKDRER